MTTKRLPIGICDHCEGEIPAQDWYTAHGQPRRYCSIDCRNTANSRAGNPTRTAKLRQAVAEGRWQNPHHLHPPTGAEQAARAQHQCNCPAARSSARPGRSALISVQ